MNYDVLSGTSMATPVVAGLAGLLLSRYPSLTASQVKGSIEASAPRAPHCPPRTGHTLSVLDLASWSSVPASKRMYQAKLVASTRVVDAQ